MTQPRRLSRRTALTTAVGAAALPLCHIRTAGAAGKLTGAALGLFVPGFAETLQKVVGEWGAKTKTDARLDIIAYNGAELSEAGEAQAAAGHDFRGFFGSSLKMHQYAEQLEPMDDLIGQLSAQYGALHPLTEYEGMVAEVWRGVPGAPPTVNYTCETRIDLLKQYAATDVQAVFPARPEMPAGYGRWTWDAFLVAAEACAKTGFPFGLPMGQTSDATSWVDALFRGFGAALVDAKGSIVVRSDSVHAAIDYARRLMPFLPSGVYSWDDASNNRALISGKSALIINPPSAWAAAVKDNPKIGELIWHHPLPSGPHGRFVPSGQSFWGVWEFSQNKTAAKELILWLGQREQVERLCVASRGYQLPPFASMTDFPIWAEIGPPIGTLFDFRSSRGKPPNPRWSAGQRRRLSPARSPRKPPCPR